MAGKLQSITQLAQEALTELTDSVQTWEIFLTSAAWLYKYPFHEQVLIYAQRPDARACATMDLWNKTMKRWVNTGSKGIALIDDNGSNPALKYVFDVSDTHSINEMPFVLWQQKEADEEQILEELTNHFGEIEGYEEFPFSDQLAGIVGTVVTDNLGDYYDELIKCTDGSILEGRDGLEVYAEYQRLVEDSVHYCLLTRLGMDAREYYELQSFGDLVDFNTPEMVSQLGSAVGDISEMLLRQIERTVLSIRREERDAFAKNEKVLDNTIKKESERRNEHGTHIQQAGRTDDPQPDDARPTKGEDREIREDAQSVSPRPQEGDIQSSSAEWNVDRAFDRNGQEGAGDRRNDDGSGESEKRDHRGVESRRSDEVDGADEQSETGGGGNSAARSDLHLKEQSHEPGETTSPGFLLEGTEQNQLSLIELNDSSPALTLSQQMIDEALCLGGNKSHSILRICAKFKKGKSITENVAFLKQEYKKGGRGFISNGEPVSMWFDETGISIVHGRSVKNAKGRIRLTWEQVAKRAGELLQLGRYLPKEELEQVDENERMELAERLFFFFRDGYENLPEEWWEQRTGYPDAQEFIAKTLTHEDGIEVVIQRLEMAIADIEQNPQKRRVFYDPQKLLSDVSDLKLIALEFGAQEAVRQSRKKFITEDEITTFFQDFIHVEGNKYAAYIFFQKEKSTQKRANFLKKAYGIGGRSSALSGTDSSWEDHDGKGITLSRGDITAPYDKVQISWVNAAKYISDLIESDQYLNAEEKAYLPEYVRKQEERERKWEEERLLHEAERRVAQKEQERRETAPYQYALGDEVCIATGIHAVLGISDVAVTVNDEKYPLLTKDIPRDEFERELRTYPDNDKYLLGAKQFAETPLVEADVVNANAPHEDVEVDTDNQVSLRSLIIDYGSGTPTIEPAPAEKKTAIRTDYQITNNELGYGGKKEKFQNNIAAIKALQGIESENRLATPEEQEILAQYVGWGGIAEAFDEQNEAWKGEYAELKALLTESEYRLALGSVLNAHYTSPTVIRAMYDCVSRMGFETGNILEPSCGTGNFFGMLPESMKSSKLYGIELDDVTGRIAKQLYQNAEIAIQGFEHTNLPDSFFDLAVGNVPFGNYGVSDKRYDKNKFSIHDYFFAKTLDKVRPGGIVAFVVSRFTMDKHDSKVRKYIAERAEFLGAVRLPNNAFQKNAGTAVTADILFLQKRDRPQAIEPDWIHTEKTDEGFVINSYFNDHPEMILGTLSTENSQYGGKDIKCLPIPGADLDVQLNEALSHIDARITDFDVEFAQQDESESIPADPNVRNYSYTLHDGKIYFRENSRMNKVEVSLTAENRIRGMIGIRDCLRRLIDLQMENADDIEVHYEQEKLSRLYDSYTKKYGLLNSRGNSMAFSDDSAYFLICSLEILDEEGKLKRKADMFTKRTIHPQEVITSADTASAALAVSLGEKAKVDLAYMAQLTGKDEQELVRELRGVVFRNFRDIDPEQMAGAFFDPEKFPLVTADEYLSGDVRAKLKQVQSIYDVLKSHSADADLLNVVEIQVEALKRVQPKDLTASEINVRLGATWIPTEYIEQFTYELLQPSDYLKEKIRVRYSPSTATWNISNKGWDNKNVAVTNTYGTKRMIAYKIIEDTLNLKDVRVWDKKTDVHGNEIRVLNPQETMIAQQKQQSIKDAFCKWIWQDIVRRDALCGIYNERFNSIRPREYDGSHLRFRGMNPEIVLREHQENAVARVIYGGNTLLAHVVGAGKSATRS